MRFIGNKENLIAKIYDFMCECGVVRCSDLTKTNYTNSKNLTPQNSQKTFFDMFSGSASVSRFFKAKGFSVQSCDLLYFSYCLQRAYLQNNDKPEFSLLNELLCEKNNQLFKGTPYQQILAFLNDLPLKQGFIYQNYAPSGSKNLAKPRMYFSDENAQKIDAIRTQIEIWKNQSKITQDEYFILLATLIESVSFFANVAGVYAAFCKVWDKRALKPFMLKEIQLFKSENEHFCFCENAPHLLEKSKNLFDIIYLDPPYNHRQYAPNYHLIETIARYDNPKIQGVAGLREWQSQKSAFCNAKSALLELEKIAKSGKFKHLVLSYNSEGIMQKSQIDELFKGLGKVHFRELDYPRFKSKMGASKKFIKEFVWIVQI